MEAWRKFDRTGNPTDFAIGNHVNGGTIFHNSHAEVTAVYAIGGNHTSKLHSAYNSGKHYYDADRVNLLKEMAEELGFNLVKKRKKEPKQPINVKSKKALPAWKIPIPGIPVKTQSDKVKKINSEAVRKLIKKKK
jgi:hypothetical protein